MVAVQQTPAIGAASYIHRYTWVRYSCNIDHNLRENIVYFTYILTYKRIQPYIDLTIYYLLFIRVLAYATYKFLQNTSTMDSGISSLL